MPNKPRKPTVNYKKMFIKCGIYFLLLLAGAGAGMAIERARAGNGRSDGGESASGGNDDGFFNDVGRYVNTDVEAHRDIYGWH